jgi:RNA polymerase sigma-70 factor (ECF subfamily)
MLNNSEYNTLIKLYSDGLYRYILKANSNPAEAQDIVQNVFLQLWEKRDQIKVETAKSLLYKMAYQNMIDIYRSEKARQQREVMPEPESVNPSAQYGSRELLDQAFDLLKPEEKNIILLRDYEGYTYDEISEMLNRPLSSIKVGLYRARKKMQHHLLILENEVR